MRKGRAARGLTLIELLVAMAIVGLIFAVAAVALRSAFNVELKRSANQLAATLRYLSNKAVTDHKYLRILFNLDDQSYRVEESPDPMVISPEEESGEKEEEKAQAKEEGEEEEEKEGEEAEAKPTFTVSESSLLKPTKLPSGVFFKDVSVSYLKEKKEKGEVAAYFFPDGYATPTLINLRDEADEDHLSIEVLPLSGRVKVEGEYRESLTEERK